MGSLEVAGPQPAAQGVVHVVGQRDRLSLVPERRDRDKGPEDLLLAHSVLRLRPDDGRLDVAAASQRGIFRSPAAGEDLPTLVQRDLHVAQDTVPVLGRRERPHLGGGLQRVADPDRSGQRDEAIDESVRDGFLDEQA